MGKYHFSSESVLTVLHWGEASSLEWPVVIYVGVNTLDLTFHDFPFEYRKYRAITRATAMLIEINLTFDESDYSDSDDYKTKQEDINVAPMTNGALDGKSKKPKVFAIAKRRHKANRPGGGTIFTFDQQKSFN